MVRSPIRPVPLPDVTGVGHALHAVRTDVGTRILCRALADSPAVAITALIARLFTSLVLRQHRRPEESALNLVVRAFEPRSGRVLETVDGQVRSRLEQRRLHWDASGETVVAWVHSLEETDRLTLLAELTAVTLDLGENRTTAIRMEARATAAELETLCGFDPGWRWTPDEPFLDSHSKPLLQAMLSEMGAARADDRVKKSELVGRVARAAASRSWTPKALAWAPEPIEDPVDEGGDRDSAWDGPEAGVDDDPVGDGIGAFVVTQAGEAVLDAAG